MKQYFAFQWHITDDCDQRCKHCYIFAENACKQPDSMTWEQMQEVVANCEDFCEMYGRLPYFYITGGDPILHPDFWPLLELLAVKRIPFTMMDIPFEIRIVRPGIMPKNALDLHFPGALVACALSLHTDQRRVFITVFHASLQKKRAASFPAALHGSLHYASF